jgi:hypothetical protein
VWIYLSDVSRQLFADCAKATIAAMLETTRQASPLGMGDEDGHLVVMDNLPGKTFPGDIRKRRASKGAARVQYIPLLADPLGEITSRFELKPRKNHVGELPH